MMTREECIASTGPVVAEAYRLMLTEGTPREAAERAFTPTGPPLDELEERIRLIRSARARYKKVPA